MSVRTICAKANAQSLVALRIPRGQSLAENVALEERSRGQGAVRLNLAIAQNDVNVSS
jgi:hypothetical protein